MINFTGGFQCKNDIIIGLVFRSSLTTHSVSILNQSNKTKGLISEVRALGPTLKDNFWASKYFLKC